MDGMQKTIAILSDETQTFEGTCQVCFQVFVVRYAPAKGWHVVKHGFKRPGTGETHGACNGEHCAPYELSAAMVHSYLNARISDLGRQESFLERLESGMVETLLIEVERPREERVVGSTRTKMISIDRSYEGQWGCDFNFHMKNRIREINNRIRDMKASIAFLTVKAKEWKYAPEKLVTHEAAEAARLERTAEEKEMRRKARVYKHFFQMLADCVKEHRDATKSLVEYRPWVAEHPEPQFQATLARMEGKLAVVGPFTRVVAKKNKKK